MHYSEHELKQYETLYRSLGNELVALLDDTDINEIMLNPDGRLWINSNQKGLCYYDDISQQQAVDIINRAAELHGRSINAHTPSLEVQLPWFRTMKGQRFTAQVPPIVAFPSFTIQRRIERVDTLKDYITSQRIKLGQYQILADFIKNRKNILICGNLRSGKTALANALLLEAIAANPEQRFLILEHGYKLQCPTANKVTMLTHRTTTMCDLLRLSMRMRPDRIVIDDIKEIEILELLQTWNTVCPGGGGIATLNTQNISKTLQYLLEWAQQTESTERTIALLGNVIHAIVSVTQQGLVEITTIHEYSHEGFILKKLA